MTINAKIRKTVNLNNVNNGNSLSKKSIRNGKNIFIYIGLILTRTAPIRKQVVCVAE